MSLCDLLSSFSPSGKMVALQRSDETKSTALDLIRGYPNLAWHRLLPLRCDSLGAGGTTLASTRLLIRSSCRDAKAQLIQQKLLILFPPLFSDRCKPNVQPAFTLYRDTAHLMPDPHRVTFVRNNLQGLMQANLSNGAYKGRQRSRSDWGEIRPGGSLIRRRQRRILACINSQLTARRMSHTSRLASPRTM